MPKGMWEPDFKKLYRELMKETKDNVKLSEELFSVFPWKKQLLTYLKMKSLEKKCPKTRKQLREEIEADLNEAYGDEENED